MTRYEGIIRLEVPPGAHREATSLSSNVGLGRRGLYPGGNEVVFGVKRSLIVNNTE